MSADVPAEESIEELLKEDARALHMPKGAFKRWLALVLDGVDFVAAMERAHGRYPTKREGPTPERITWCVKKLLRRSAVRRVIEEGFLLRGNMAKAKEMVLWGGVLTLELAWEHPLLTDSERSRFYLALRTVKELGPLRPRPPAEKSRPATQHRALRAVPRARSISDLEEPEELEEDAGP